MAQITHLQLGLLSTDTSTCKSQIWAFWSAVRRTPIQAVTQLTAFRIPVRVKLLATGSQTRQSSFFKNAVSTVEIITLIAKRTLKPSILLNSDALSYKVTRCRVQREEITASGLAGAAARHNSINRNKWQ